MKEILLFLDIDGVLNSSKEHVILNKVFEKEDYQNLISKLNYVEKELKVVKFLRTEDEKHPIDFGNFVSIEKTKKLKDLIEKHNVKVFGISSWFVGVKNGSRDLKLIEECLGFKIDECLYVGGVANSRLKGVIKYLEEKYKNDFSKILKGEVKVLYLDDDVRFNYNIEDKYNNLKDLMIMKKLFNILYLPEEGNGITEEDFNKMEQYLSF